MTDKEYQHALDVMEKGIRADERVKTVNEIKRLVKQLSNSGYRDIDEDWVDSSCNTDDLLEELEAMKEGAE